MIRLWFRLTIFLLLLTFTASLFASNREAVSAHINLFSTDASRVPVLGYHMVGDLKISLSVTPQDFEQQMKYLSDNGYTAITPNQLYNHIKYGEPLPEKPIMI